MKKNIVFCGFGKLGKDCMKRLVEEGYNIIYVLTHREEDFESVDTFSKHNNIKYSYQDIRRDKSIINNIIKHFEIDYIVSINYRYIIPKEMFSISRYAINIHGSLLPKYRGRTPHVWSIINGEDYSGVTCHIIDEGIDTGNIIEQTTVKIENNDTGFSLLKKFQKIYPNILIRSLNKLEKGIKPIKQNEDQASYYGKRTPDMGYIDFYKNSTQIINFVRAQAYPYPGAYYYLSDGRKIIINSLEIEEESKIEIKSIGVIKYKNNNYYVKCLDRLLKLARYEVVV